MNDNAQAAETSAPPHQLVVRTTRRAREHPKVVRLRHSEKTVAGHILEVTEDDVGVVELHEQ